MGLLKAKGGLLAKETDMQPKVEKKVIPRQVQRDPGHRLRGYYAYPQGTKCRKSSWRKMAPETRASRPQGEGEERQGECVGTQMALGTVLRVTQQTLCRVPGLKF